MNNSWGYGVSGIFYDNFAPDLRWRRRGAGFRRAAGCGGLGTNIVFAAANYRSSGDNTNYHNFQNDRHVITVASAQRRDRLVQHARRLDPGHRAGRRHRHHRPGRLGRLHVGRLHTQFGGTSAAAPIVSGVVALMLDANPYLGYRDVQEILAYSARQTSVTSGYQYNGATNWNGAGLHFSNDFGAGLVDAHAAVRLAETWGPQHTPANE